MGLDWTSLGVSWDKGLDWAPYISRTDTMLAVITLRFPRQNGQSVVMNKKWRKVSHFEYYFPSSWRHRRRVPWLGKVSFRFSSCITRRNTQSSFTIESWGKCSFLLVYKGSERCKSFAGVRMLPGSGMVPFVIQGQPKKTAHCTALQNYKTYFNWA